MWILWLWFWVALCSMLYAVTDKARREGRDKPAPWWDGDDGPPHWFWLSFFWPFWGTIVFCFWMSEDVMPDVRKYVWSRYVRLVQRVFR